MFLVIVARYLLLLLVDQWTLVLLVERLVVGISTIVISRRNLDAPSNAMTTIFTFVSKAVASTLVLACR